MSDGARGGELFGAGAARLAGLAARLLCWTPDIFWAATPAELAASLGLCGAEGGEAIDRAGFERLRARFPDEEGQ